MTKKQPNGPDTGAARQQMGGERVAQGVDTRVLVDPGKLYGLLELLLQPRLGGMTAEHGSAARTAGD